MPISIIELDSSTKQENITLILGKNILLKIIEDLEKQTLLKNKTVKEFVSIRNLCHDDIRLLIEELIKEEAFLFAPGLTRTFLSFAKGENLNLFFTLENSLKRYFADSKLYKTLEKEISQTVKRKFERMPRDELQTICSSFMHGFVGKVDEKWVKTENKKLLSIGDKINEKTGFEILVPSSILLCPKCKVILSTEEFTGAKKCYICNKNITRENAKRIYVYKVNEQVKRVWEKNLWFEAYMARLLRKLDCKTWTSVHVMGASGILHEVDVLAIRNGTILICECKTGKVSRNDVFNFCTKISDLKSHIAILALIGELPEPETREFVRKNPAIIRLENMGKREEADILNELRRRLSIKA